MKKKLTLILVMIILSLAFTQLSSAARPNLIIPTFTIYRRGLWKHGHHQRDKFHPQ